MILSLGLQLVPAIYFLAVDGRTDKLRLNIIVLRLRNSTGGRVRHIVGGERRCFREAVVAVDRIFVVVAS